MGWITDIVKAILDFLSNNPKRMAYAIIGMLIFFVGGCCGWQLHRGKAAIFGGKPEVVAEPEPQKPQFGWRVDEDQVEATILRLPQPRFADAAAGIKDSWDGKTNKLLYLAARKANGGKDLPVQRQNRGTCVSRSVTNAINYGNAVARASGEKVAIIDASHAFIYGCAKEIMHDVGRQNLHDSGDGLTGAAGAEAATKFGVVTDEQAGDDNNDDKLAIKWAVSGVPAEMKALGKEHPVKTVSRVSSFDEVADAIANGYPVVVCSRYGFNPVPNTRDKDGFLRNRGDWAHAMTFIGVVNVNGRKGVVCLNSWGDDWISGDNPLDMPAGCFCIDAKTVDGMVGGRMKDSFAYSNFVGFPRRENVDVFISAPFPRPDVVRGLLNSPFASKF